MISAIKKDIDYLTTIRQHIQVVHAGREIGGHIVIIDKIITIQNHLKQLQTTLQNELDKKRNYHVTVHPNGNVVTINHITINEDVFDKELIDYKPQNRLELIEFIQSVMCEANEQDLVLMREDIDCLKTIDDEICFSSTLTNEYVFFSEQPKEFNEICENILDEHNKLSS